MAQIANITVKNRTAADVTFTALQGASGESPAVWRVNTPGTPPILCPTFHAWQKQNKDGTVRRIEWKLVLPVGDMSSGVATLSFKLLSSGVHYIPQGADAVGPGDLAAFVGGLLSSPQMVDAFKNGYLPV